MSKQLDANLRTNLKKNSEVKMKLNTRLEIGMRCCWFPGCAVDQIQAVGGRTAKMSDCNKLWSVYAADCIGLVSKDAREQSAGATPSGQKAT
jgi:hypothetical protein